MKKNKVRLGLNIDHVATIRNARGQNHPCPLKAAVIAEKCKVDGITIHLREDRRHIKDSDLKIIKKSIKLPINLEMAATKEMLDIALEIKPHAVCIVPEKRREVTTEGGLDVEKNKKNLQKIISKLKKNKIKVSIFIDPNKKQILESKKIGADIVEIHTGEFCRIFENNKNKAIKILKTIKECVEYANSLNLECHAGHGLNYETANIISKIKEIKELNIGHFMIGESIFEGLEEVIKKMKKSIS